MTDKTLQYYDQHASDFSNNTINVNFKETQDHFLGYLRPGAFILDFGCGSGRDTKYFLEQGYKVNAIDGSKELCLLASRYTGIDVKEMRFSELNAVDTYEAIWACSSILHVPRSELRDIIIKMITALKDQGIIYTSFKYGSFEGERHGRYFTDLTLESFSQLIEDVDHIALVEYWITGDVRPGRGEEQWLNVICRKQ